jgi:arsenate reductase
MNADETFDRPVVLFLCRGNSARSQMAEPFLEKYGNGRFIARSAGLEPKGVNPLTVRCMQEIGINLSDKRSKPVSEFLGHVPVRYAISVCANAERHCPRIWPFGTEFLFWPFDDPAAGRSSEEERLAVFQRTRDEIEARVLEWLAAANA